MSFLSRHFTKIGRIPDFIKSSMGGFLSLDSSFLGGKPNISIVLPAHKTSRCAFIPVSPPGCLHSTELDNRVLTGSILWGQENRNHLNGCVSDLLADNRWTERSKLSPLRWHQEYRFAAKRGTDEILLVPVKCIYENTMFTSEFPADKNNW